MSGESNSWLRRTKFSHAVYQRMDPSRFPAILLSHEADGKTDSKTKSVGCNSPKSVSIPLPLDCNADVKQKIFTRHSNTLLPMSFSREPVQVGELKGKNSLSKISNSIARPVQDPTAKLVCSDAKPKETAASIRSAFVCSLSALDHTTLMKVIDKQTSRKESSWTRYFDHGGSRVTAVEARDDLAVNRSQLYLGLRFASGVHSRLYHGIYMDQPVAVKLIRQPDDDDDNGETAARLEKQYNREVGFLAHLCHQNVIKLVAADKSPPVFCIITEYLSGGSLRAFLHKLEHNSIPLPKLIAIALNIARGMAYLHSQGVIHRDLKPENILLDEDSCVKIADFGIACEAAHCDTLDDEAGTYRWMAPEMIKHKPYGRKVDIYSYGLLLWEMVSGRIPYEDMSPYQAAFAVVDKNLRPAIPANCPTVLRALIEQCWALDPRKRPEFGQIVKILEQMESILAEGGNLDSVKNLTCRDDTNRLRHWFQKLKHLRANRPMKQISKAL